MDIWENDLLNVLHGVSVVKHDDDYVLDEDNLCTHFFSYNLEQNDSDISAQCSYINEAQSSQNCNDCSDKFS